MCFSAGASFTASVVLSVVGVATQRKVKKPNQRLFAAIPLLFGFQQFAEGALWITLETGKHDWLQDTATYIFLIIALVIWPVMVPLSMWFMEKAKMRKRILGSLVVIGGMVALFFAFCLILYDVTPQIKGFHLQYIAEFPRTPANIAAVFYPVLTVIPLFISSVKWVWLLGLLISISGLITFIFFEQYGASVWCFFAALSSIVIYWIISKSQATVPSVNGGKGIAVHSS